MPVALSAAPLVARARATPAHPRDHRRRRVDAMHKLVLLRHGESTWNRENRFTGWTDVDLTEHGRAEAREAGRLLKAEGFDFDVAFTSVLQARDPHAVDRARRDGPHVAAGHAVVAPERAPLRRAAGARQGRDRGASTATRRCWSGAAATTRRRIRSRRTTRARASRDPRYAGLDRARHPADRVPEGHRRPRAAVLERRRSRRRSAPASAC